MQALLEQGGYDMPQRGDIREGTVLSVGPQEVIIDLGLKREGIVPANDLARLDKDTLAEVQEGTTWPVYILQTSDREGNLIVSFSRAQQEKDWLDAQKMMDSNEIFEAQVTGFNSGGLEVAFGKLRGFVPGLPHLYPAAQCLRRGPQGTAGGVRRQDRACQGGGS